DPADPDTRPLAPRNFREIATQDFALDPRLAFVRTPVWDQADAEARGALEALAGELGEACFTHDLPERYAEAWDAQAAIMAAEMAANLGPLADRGGDKVSPRFHDLMAEGRKVSAVRYLDALALRGGLRAAIEELFQQEC